MLRMSRQEDTCVKKLDVWASKNWTVGERCFLKAFDSLNVTFLARRLLSFCHDECTDNDQTRFVSFSSRLPGFAGKPAGAVRWTVDDCMRYAVEQNYRVRNSRLDTRIAGEDLTAAYGDFLPSVSATGALGKRLGRSVDPKTNLYTSSSFLESTMGLNVSLPVFDGFTRVNRLQFRKLNKQIGGLTEQIEENPGLPSR